MRMITYVIKSFGSMSADDPLSCHGGPSPFPINRSGRLRFEVAMLRLRLQIQLKNCQSL